MCDSTHTYIQGASKALDFNSGVSVLTTSARLSAKPEQVVPSVGDADSSVVEGTASLMSAASSLLTIEQLLGSDNAAQFAMSTSASVVDAVMRLPRSMRTSTLKIVVDSASRLQRIIGRSMSVYEQRKTWVFNNLCTTVEKLRYSSPTFTVEGAKAGANVTVTLAESTLEKVRSQPMIVQTIYVAVPWYDPFRLKQSSTRSARPISSLFGAEIIVPETPPRKRAYFNRQSQDWTQSNYSHHASEVGPEIRKAQPLLVGTSITHSTSVTPSTTWSHYLRKSLHDGRTSRYGRTLSKDQRRARSSLSEYGGNAKVQGMAYTVNIPLNLQEVSTDNQANLEIFTKPFECVECLRWTSKLDGDFTRNGCKLNSVDRAGSSVQCTCDNLGWVIAVYTPLETPLVAGTSAWSEMYHFIHLRVVLMVIFTGLAIVVAQLSLHRKWHKRIHEDNTWLHKNFRDWQAFQEKTPLNGNITGWFGGNMPPPALVFRFFEEGSVVSEDRRDQSSVELFVPSILVRAVTFARSGASMTDYLRESSLQVSHSVRKLSLGRRTQNLQEDTEEIQDGDMVLSFGPELFDEMSGPYTAKMHTFIQHLHQDICFDLKLFEGKSMLKILPPARDENNCALFMIRFAGMPDDPHRPEHLAMTFFRKWTKMVNDFRNENRMDAFRNVHKTLMPYLCRVQHVSLRARLNTTDSQERLLAHRFKSVSNTTGARKDKIEVDPHSAPMPPFIGLTQSHPETPHNMWQSAQVPPPHPLLKNDNGQAASSNQKVGADFTGAVPVSMRVAPSDPSSTRDMLYISSPAHAVLVDQNTYMAAMQEYLGDLDIGMS